MGMEQMRVTLGTLRNPDGHAVYIYGPTLTARHDILFRVASSLHLTPIDGKTLEEILETSSEVERALYSSYIFRTFVCPAPLLIPWIVMGAAF